MSRERVHGPYKHRNRFRVYHLHADGRRETLSFSDEADARRYIARVRRAADCKTVEVAVSAYLQHLRTTNGRGGRPRRECTIRLEAWRLSGLLRFEANDAPITSLTPSAAARLVQRRQAEVRPDTLHGELVTVARWARWCVGRRWLRSDPFAGIEATGERSAGKPQLRVDEARRFVSAALAELSGAGLASAMALLMGMRASEITGLAVRDVDDGGRLVWVTRAKSRRGVRRLAVPSVLVPRLAALAANRNGDERLFGDVDRHWLHYHVVRLCDVARLPRVTPHGLRGTWATISVRALPTEQVAAALGHDPKVTLSNYAEAGSADSAASRRVEEVIDGPEGVEQPKLAGWN